MPRGVYDRVKAGRGKGMRTGQNSYSKVERWAQCEMITVNGYKLTYHLDDYGNLTVHMPGGEHRSELSLRAAGYLITLPKTLRTTR